MTEEEYEQKAEEWFEIIRVKYFKVDDMSYSIIKGDIKQAYKDGYKQGQESMLFEFALEDRGKLLKKIEELKATISTMEITTSELIAQIEKMKCCQNCKYYDEDNYCEMRRCIIHTLIGGCENWEIAK